MTKEVMTIQDIVVGANMGLLSAAKHKKAAWELALEPFPNIIATGLPIRKRAIEPDVTGPEETAIGKLRQFAAQSDVKSFVPILSPDATATTVDVLFTVHDRVLTTDRDKVGAALTIGALGEVLWGYALSGKPAAIRVSNTTGTARVKDLVRYTDHLPRELIYANWVEGEMVLSPALIGLLYKPKKLFNLHKLGIVGPGIVNPESIAGVNWVELIRWLPHLARAKGGAGVWAELDLGRHSHFVLDKDTKDTTEATAIFESWARGIPASVVHGIVNHYLN